MVLIIDCGSSKVPDIGKSVADNGHQPHIVKYDALQPDDYQKAVAVIVSGAPVLLTEVNPLPYLQQLRFLLDYEKPVLGICFGHQILGMLHGAKIQKCEAARTVQRVRFTGADVLFDGLESEGTFKQDHTECITLPKNFKHLAFSHVCINEAMRHPTKPHWGVQFHPESETVDGQTVIRNFLKTVNFTAS